MFIILNKEKIYTYVISIATVVMLFGIANILYIGEKSQKQEIENNQKAESSQEVASNQTKKLPIYNVETKEKKIAFTMNCAWSRIPMG
ncbi:MAG: hypothetical protein HFJ47_04510 [Clostridia bacterium]|nr:hypothetical protein [Clostridia bacterium]